MKMDQSDNKSQFLVLQILLALVGLGISFILVFNVIAGSNIPSSRYILCFIHFPSFMMIIILGSFGLILNRGRFIGLNYFIAGIINTLFNILMLYKNTSSPDQIQPGLAAAALSTFYGSLLLIVMATTYYLAHKKNKQDSNTRNLPVTELS